MTIALHSAEAMAQMWVDDRTTPALHELVSVDQTGERNWLFGAEDVAGDGLSVFAEPEQAIDVRSAYAATDQNRLWLRVYVSGAVTPRGLRVHVFVDTDRDRNTGGSANAPEVEPLFGPTPAPGGHDVVLGFRESDNFGDVWRWSEANQEFERLPNLEGFNPLIEAGADLDPLRLGAPPNGYLQVAIDLAALNVAFACNVDFFIRSSAGMGLGDRDVGAAGPCMPADTNANGIADLAESDAACERDDQCPARGSCRDGRCRAPDFALEPGDAVQGGAFTCETSRGQPSPHAGWIGFVGFIFSVVLCRHKRPSASSRRGAS